MTIVFNDPGKGWEIQLHVVVLSGRSVHNSFCYNGFSNSAHISTVGGGNYMGSMYMISIQIYDYYLRLG